MKGSTNRQKVSKPICYKVPPYHVPHETSGTGPTTSGPPPIQTHLLYSAACLVKNSASTGSFCNVMVFSTPQSHFAGASCVTRSRMYYLQPPSHPNHKRPRSKTKPPRVSGVNMHTTCITADTVGCTAGQWVRISTRTPAGEHRH